MTFKEAGIREKGGGAETLCKKTTTAVAEISGKKFTGSRRREGAA